MTTLIASPVTTTTAYEPSDPVAEHCTALRRRAAGLSLIGGAVVSLAGYLSCNWEGSSGTPAYLQSLLEHPRQSMISMILLHFGYLLLVPAAFAMARLARRGAPRLSATGIVLAVLGSGLSGLLVTDLYDLSIARHLGTTAGAPVSDMTGVPLAIPSFLSVGLLTVLGMILGLVLLAGAMRRARLVPVWPAIAMFAGFAATYGVHDALRACTGFGVFAAGLAYLGWRVLRMSDARFAYGSDAR